MSRLVVPHLKTRTTLQAKEPLQSKAISQSGDDYTSRVAKYIPGEVLAGYISIGNVIATIDSNPKRIWLGGLLVTVCMVVLPFYLGHMAQRDQPKRLHIIISMFAFVIWAYAIGGPFIAEPWYDRTIGAIALGLFTLVSGAFVPRLGDE